MLSITQAVWRHLLVGAREDQRRWPSITALAEELDLGVSTVHKALAQPVEIEGVRVSRLAGLVVLDPYRLLLMFAATRRLQRDIVSRHRVALSARSVEALAGEDPRMILGGSGRSLRTWVGTRSRATPQRCSTGIRRSRPDCPQAPLMRTPSS